MANTAKRTIIAGPFRLSYMNVFKPQTNRLNGKLEYNVTLLLPKEPNEFCKDPTGIRKQLGAAIMAVATEQFGKDKIEDKAFKWTMPFKDGDKDLDDDGNARDPGYWSMRSKANLDYPPILIDGAGRPVTGGWNSGDWGRAELQIYGYDNAKRGVSAGLLSIQFLFKGEPLGNTSDPESVANRFGIVPEAHTVSQQRTSDRNDAPDDELSDPFADS